MEDVRLDVKQNQPPKEEQKISSVEEEKRSTTANKSKKVRSQANKSNARKAPVVEEYHCEEHHDSLEQLAERHGVNLNIANIPTSVGLSKEEAQRRYNEFGPNVLKPPKKRPLIVDFLLKFTDKFMVLLMIAGIMCFVAYGLDTSQSINMYLGIALFAIVFLTCCMTFAQELVTANVMNSIQGMMATTCGVVRDGVEERVNPSVLVVGDLVHLRLGDRVPADLRIVFTQDLKTECSSLTGEPDAIAATVNKIDDRPIEARNIVFSSSLVMNGEGYGVVIKTANNTMIGSIAVLAASSGQGEKTLLEKEVVRFVNFISILAVISAGIFFGIGMGRGRGFINSFVNGFIVVLVANVPEGLPTTVTSCLAITAKRMAARHVLIKRTNIIESLGSATVIASDKTGTLTQNRMTVENMWFCRAFYSAHGHSSRPDVLEAMVGIARHRLSRSDSKIDPKLQTLASALVSGVANQNGDSYSDAAKESVANEVAKVLAQQGMEDISRVPSIIRTTSLFSIEKYGDVNKAYAWTAFTPHAKLLTICGVCNRATYEGDEDESVPKTQRKILGDSSDAALLRFCDSSYSIGTARKMFPKLFEIPFNSVNKWSLCVVADPALADTQHIIFLKGAPEIVLRKCENYMDNKMATRPIDADFSESFTAAYERFGSCGERVLGCAYKVIEARPPRIYHDDDKEVDKEGFTFCGLVSLVDPPRDGVREAVDACRTAGIKVTMVTGDHPLTAEAIARKVGIITLPTRLDIAHEDGVPLANIPMADPRVMAAVVTGSDIPAMSEEDWDVVLSKKECVFARTSPQQKLQLVTHYQRRKEIVAVTGDGVNDAPALKQAQIGVAMGSPAASEVARDAADIILLDDNFASIVSAIEEGRTVFDNLKKTIAYTLAHLWPELLPVFLNLAFSFPLALNGLMILSIDLITEQGPAISLAYEQPESAIMHRPPRNLKTQRLVSVPSLFYSYVIAGCGEMLVCMFAYFLVFIHNGIPVSKLTYSLDKGYFVNEPVYSRGNDIYVDGKGHPIPTLYTDTGKPLYADDQWHIAFEASAAYYMTLIVCQFWHVWNCRTRTESIFTHGCGNVVTIFGCMASLGIMLAVVYIPAFQRTSAFGTYDLHGLYYAPQFIFLVYITVFNETVKWFVRHRPNSLVVKLFGW